MEALRSQLGEVGVYMLGGLVAVHMMCFAAYFYLLWGEIKATRNQKFKEFKKTM